MLDQIFFSATYDNYNEFLDKILDEFGDEQNYSDYYVRFNEGYENNDFYYQTLARINNEIPEFVENNYVIDESIMNEAMKLKRKYNDFYSWMEAIDIYNAYINELINKYFSMSIIKSTFEIGLLPEYLPQEPKLKMNGRNKRMLKFKNNLPSRAYPISEEVSQKINERLQRELMNMIEMNNVKYSTDDSYERESMKTIPKKDRKVYKQHLDQLKGNNRKQSIYLSKRSSIFDSTMEYYKQNMDGTYDRKGEYKSNKKSLLKKGKKDKGMFKEILNESWMREHIPSEVLESRYVGPKLIVGGNMIDGEEARQAELIKQIYEDFGMNLLKTAGKNLSKEQIRFIKSETDMLEEDMNRPMSKKELKKLKKKKKKDENKLKFLKERSSDIIDNFLFNNKIKEGSLDDLVDKFY